MKIRTDDTDDGIIEITQFDDVGKKKRFIASAKPRIKGRIEIFINGVSIARKNYDADKLADKDKAKIDTAVEVDFDPDVDLLEFRWYRGY